VPLGSLLIVSLFVAPSIIGRECEIRNRLTALDVSKFRIASEISHQNDFVYARHE
jgi:hypothetical protein